MELFGVLGIITIVTILIMALVLCCRSWKLCKLVIMHNHQGYEPRRWLQQDEMLKIAIKTFSSAITLLIFGLAFVLVMCFGKMTFGWYGFCLLISVSIGFILSALLKNCEFDIAYNPNRSRH